MLSRTDSNVLENWNRDFRFTGRNCNSALIVPSSSTNIIILLPLCRGLLKQKWLNLESIIGNLLKLDKATARKLNYCQLYVNVSIWSSCYLFHVTVFVAYKKVKSFGWNWKQIEQRNTQKIVKIICCDFFLLACTPGPSSCRKWFSLALKFLWNLNYLVLLVPRLDNRKSLRKAFLAIVHLRCAYSFHLQLFSFKKGSKGERLFNIILSIFHHKRSLY